MKPKVVLGSQKVVRKEKLLRKIIFLCLYCKSNLHFFFIKMVSPNKTN